MEKKINLVELLKDCPKGMELDSPMFEGLEFDSIVNNDYFSIRCRIKHPDGGYNYNFTKYGCWTDAPFSKCVIFPKGKKTWEGFVPPCKFKDGDIVTNIEGAVIIYKGITTCGYCGSFASLDRYNQFIPHYQSYLTGTIRFATDDEKSKLFQAIKGNGYKWNAETKTLEKLVHNKFDITTLKAFESRVLVRDKNTEKWIGHFFSHYDNSDKPYVCIGVEGLSEYKQCIPYEGNEYLLGSSEECEEFYKTW